MHFNEKEGDEPNYLKGPNYEPSNPKLKALKFGLGSMFEQILVGMAFWDTVFVFYYWDEENFLF